MPQFSILVRVQNPIQRELQALVASLEAQTSPDWELVLAVPHSAATDWLTASALCEGRPRLRAVLRPDSELLAWSANALLPTLGTWTGLLDQHDRLVPTALASLAAAITPQSQVVYADECHRDRWGRLSYEHRKAAFDPVRLLTQEHLGSPAFIRTALLTASGGFDRLASDVPTHDLYLRIAEAHGPAGFVHVPQTLVQHHRNYLVPPPADVRRLPHLVRYDLYAITRALARRQLTAKVEQRQGTAQVGYQHPLPASVTLVVVLDDDATAGVTRIHAVNRTVDLRRTQVRLLHRGTDSQAGIDYQVLAKALGYRYDRAPDPLVTTLNQWLPREDADWLGVLDGLPVSWGWLKALLGQAQLPGMGAVGARCMTPIELVAPGELNYRYAGWDWNTRGRFNHLQVPHSTGALGSGATLFDARRLRALGGFREDLPTLWAMDASIRLDAAGQALVQVPEAVVQVATPAPIDPAERELFTTSHPGWSDRYGLHLPL